MAENDIFLYINDARTMQPYFYAHPDATPPAAQLLNVEADGRMLRYLPTYMASEQFTGNPRWPGIRTRADEHLHEVYHVLLYTAGEGHFSWQGRWHAARRGTLIVTEPGQTHLFGSQSNADSAYVHITFRLCGASTPLPFADYLGALTGLSGLQGTLPVQLTKQAIRRGEDLYHQIFDALELSRPVNWFLVQRRILDLFSFLIEEVYAPRGTAQRVEPLEAARRELDWRYAEPVAVEELARIACLSQGQFLRAFRRAFGDSPIHYQKCLRVQAAKNLLLTTHLACKEIAAQVGFGDEYHFSKAFRQVAGLPPGLFRQQEKM